MIGGNFAEATTQISSLGEAINRLQDKTITVTVNRVGNASGGDGSGLGGQNNDGGSAFVGGTKDKILSNQTGKTLVGEEGYEVHASRDGNYWQVVGQSGPEFRTDIAPNDVVFDHEQSVKLLKNGHINKRGKALLGGS